MTANSDSLTVEEEYLRGIWNNLGVGQNGYIDIKELGRVCKHIDMEDMDETVSNKSVKSSKANFFLAFDFV